MSRIRFEASVSDAGFQSSWILASTDHPDRRLIENFIRECFFAEYQARIRHFLTDLVCSMGAHGIAAAVGFSGAMNRELYLEQYLACPVEEALRQATGVCADRQAIIEVGNLASFSPGGARSIILALARHFHEQGLEWAVFTGVPTLINTFARLGIPGHDLGEANPEKLRDRESDWGTYYLSRPRVMAVSVPGTFDRIQANPVLARMLAQLPRFSREGRLRT
jgi:hypothetical protein